jgi:uncharacterized protein (TIGR02246 family)
LPIRRRHVSTMYRTRPCASHRGAQLLILCLCVTSLSGRLLAQSDSSAEAAVKTLVQSFIKAQQTFNPAVLKEDTTENYIEVSPLGEVDKRDAVLKFYDPADRVEVPSASITDEQIRFFKDMAVDIVAIKYTVADKQASSHDVQIRATFVAVQQQGVWKLASAHYTSIQPKTTHK